MVTLKAPNGATIEACEEHVNKLLEMGFCKVEEKAEKPKTTRKRTAKPKE